MQEEAHLDDFIYKIYANITGIYGEFKDFTIGNPKLKEDCNTIIKNGLNEELSFIDISVKSNSFKKIANIVMHIFYASPLNTKISSNSPINQYLKIKEFDDLKDTPNHQNAVIAIFYGLTLLNKEFKNEVSFSCHYLVDLTQTLCSINPDDKQQLIITTKYLSLIFEQITYKTNNKEYPLCSQHKIL